MSIKDKYKVVSIKPELCKEWLLYKHYAKRLPSIMFAFGVYDNNNIMQGIATYGMPPVHFNYGSGIFVNHKVNTWELTRLVINEGLEKNILSYFVSHSLCQITKPACIVSFADPNNGHHGYIYQATNWIYTGLTQKGGKDKQWIINGREYHAKTITREWMLKMKFQYDNSKNMTENWIANGGTVSENELRKFRYLYFLGDKKQIKRMKQSLLLPILPYPKGENKRYDASYQTTNQETLFL